MFRNLEKNELGEGNKVLLSVLVSGGQDSMCLLRALSRVLNSRLFKAKNEYQLIVHHFNHQRRGLESDADADLVLEKCLAFGVPFYLSCFPFSGKVNHFQNLARMWRKTEAVALAQHLAKDLQCSRFFILTAHHARDHVESILLNILRGSGLNGLKGIPLLDSSGFFLRPFHNVLFSEVLFYCQSNNIDYREDSSNLKDDYTRNYIRHHILPHCAEINPQYENAFLRLSMQIPKSAQSLDEGVPEFEICKETTQAQLYEFFYHMKQEGFYPLTTNFTRQILHVGQLMLSTKELHSEKVIALKLGRSVQLRKRDGRVFLFFLRS